MALEIDPPPDLVIEIDISNSSMPKLPVFFALGVPEVWRYAAGQLTMHVLGNNGYENSIESGVLPRFPVDGASRLIELRREVGETKLIREFRLWGREPLL